MAQFGGLRLNDLDGQAERLALGFFGTLLKGEVDAAD